MIRRATLQDAEAIVALIARAWRRAYADFLDVDTTLDDPATRVARWRERLRSDVVTIFVWDQAGELAGVVSVGASDETDAPLHDGAVRSLYVDPPAQGAGVGSALLEQGLEHLRASGFRGAELWTFSENAHGRAFYDRHGFAVVEQAVDPGTDAAIVRMRRDL